MDYYRKHWPDGLHDGFSKKAFSRAGVVGMELRSVENRHRLTASNCCSPIR